VVNGIARYSLSKKLNRKAGKTGKKFNLFPIFPAFLFKPAVVDSWR